MIELLGSNVFGDSSQGGGTENKKKYGATIDTFIGECDSGGTLQDPMDAPDLVFDGVKSISEVEPCPLAYKFYNTNIKSVSFPDLTYPAGMKSSFGHCRNLESISFPSLKVINSSNAFERTFEHCTKLTSVSFPNLERISANEGMKGMFSQCTRLTSITFPKLKRIDGDHALSELAVSCSHLSSITFPALEKIEEGNVFYHILTEGNKSLYFPALTTISDEYAFQDVAPAGVFTTLTIHFKSGMESIVQGLVGYPNFGGSNTTLLFDL